MARSFSLTPTIFESNSTTSRTDRRCRLQRGPKMQVDRLGRREFIMLFGGALLPSTFDVARAWQVNRPQLVGLLAFAQVLASPLFDAFRDEMRKLGYIEGRSYGLEFRSARGDPDRLKSAAMELSEIPVDVIVTDSGAASIAAKKATERIPIVMG